MKFIITDRNLKPGDEVIVPAEKAVKGEVVTFVRKKGKMQEIVAMGECVGGIESLQTPTTQTYAGNPFSKSRTAYVFKNFRKFIVKE